MAALSKRQTVWSRCEQKKDGEKTKKNTSKKVKSVLCIRFPLYFFQNYFFGSCFPAISYPLNQFSAHLDIKKYAENLQKDNLCLFSGRTKKYFFPPHSKQGGKHSSGEFSGTFFSCFSNMLKMCLLLSSSLSLLLLNACFVLMIKWCISLVVFNGLTILFFFFQFCSLYLQLFTKYFKQPKTSGLNDSRSLVRVHRDFQLHKKQ